MTRLCTNNKGAVRTEWKIAVGTVIAVILVLFVIQTIRKNRHQKLNIVSDQRGKDGVRHVILTHKTPAEIENEKRVAAVALAKAVNDVAITQKAAVQKVSDDLKKQFSDSEVQTELTAIATRKDFSWEDRRDELVDLRNLVTVSATKPAKKAQLVNMINQRLVALSGTAARAGRKSH